MDHAHKIPVTFARSITRKVQVEIDKLIDFELTDIRPPRHRAGSARADTVIAVSVTSVVLLVIVIAVMLVLNG